MMEDGEAEFEEVPQEEEEEEVVVDDGEDDDGGEGYRTESTEKKSKVTCDWSQFSMPQMNYPQQGEPLRLQVIDIEHQKRRLPRWDMDDSEVERVREAARIYGPKWKQNKPFYPTVPCIRLYCKDTRGYSYCVNAYGYYPVVHLLASIAVTDAVLTELRDYVEEQLTENESKGPFPKKRPDGWQAILTARVVEGFPAFPFSENPHTFLEFRLSDSCYVKAFGRLMRQNGGELESPSLGDVKVMPYSCQDIVDKFQADIRVSGFGWLLLDRFIRTGDAVGADDSSCDFELDTCVSWLRNVKGCDDIAPLRKITYDIECLKTEGMPDPDKDAVIVISAICGDYVNGQPAKKRKVLLQLNKADSVKNIVSENGDVHHCFDSEVDLLDAFGELVLAFDPDYICGHNMIGFDLPYLVTRANKIDADSLRYMGRRRAYRWSKPRKVVKKRKSGETRETKMTSTPGRIQLDTLNWIMGGFEKERSYRLGALAAKYLGDTKDDVGYSMIGPMFRQSDTTRARLGKYCLKDSELTEALCDLKRYQMVISSIEMSRQTRVPAGKLLRSGVQVKVWGLLLEKAKDPHFDGRGTPVFFPDEEVCERSKDDKFAGAEVLEPFRGYYSDWVGCGDFRSLYPSIIIDLNICLGKGTFVRCSDGLGREIERVCEGSSVQMYGQTETLEVGVCNNGVTLGSPNDNGLRDDCVRVTLYDGTEVVCTADHKFLTSTVDGSWEYSEARSLLGRRICCSALGCPRDDTYDEDATSYFVIGPWSLARERDKVMAFSRLLGMVLTDGSTTTVKATGCRRSCLFMGNEIDVQAVQNDIELITGKIPVAHWDERDVSCKYSGGVWCINVPSGILQDTFETLGVPSGRRTMHARMIPGIIRKAPKTVQREFIAAYWGGDGGAPSLDQKSIVGCRLVSHMLVSLPIISRDELVAHRESVRWLVETLHSVFGVHASYSESFEARMPDGKLITIDESEAINSASVVYATATATLSTVRDGFALFADRVGVRYCSDKQIRFEMSRRWSCYRNCVENQCRYEMSLLRSEKEIITERPDHCGRPSYLMRPYWRCAVCKKKVGRYEERDRAMHGFADRCAIATKEHFQGWYYTEGAANSRGVTAKYNNRGSDGDLAFPDALKLSEFCSALGYNPNIPRQRGASATIAVPVVSVTAVDGAVRVYDLSISGGISQTVAEHNFVAAGCVVHNCYTTEIRGGKYDDFSFKKSPNGVKFVDKTRRVGLLPQIEVELMANRDTAKLQAREAGKKGDAGAANMYDKRQNEIKFVCNIIYGIMTASGGRLTRMELGESVTSQGRLMIMTAKGIAEKTLTTVGHEKAGVADFKVIYG